MPRLSIDPGLTGTGWAVWRDGSDTIWQAKEPPLAHGVLVPRYGGVDSKRRLKTAPRNWLDRSKSLCLQLAQICYAWHPAIIYCEWPQLWGESEVSNSAAKQRRKYIDLSTGREFSEDSSDLFKLVALCGMYAKVAWENEGRFVPVPVSDWKGSLPKEVVAYRIGKILGASYGPEANLTHDSDAIGIGLFCKGLLHPKPTDGPNGNENSQASTASKRKGNTASHVSFRPVDGATATSRRLESMQTLCPRK